MLEQKPFGQLCVSFCAPKQHNSLPSDIRRIQSSHAVKTHLCKTILQQVIWISVFVAFVCRGQQERAVLPCLLGGGERWRTHHTDGKPEADGTWNHNKESSFFFVVVGVVVVVFRSWTHWGLHGSCNGTLTSAFHTVREIVCVTV